MIINLIYVYRIRKSKSGVQTKSPSVDCSAPNIDPSFNAFDRILTLILSSNLVQIRGAIVCKSPQ